MTPPPEPTRERSTATVALMYHALGGARGPVAGQDPHYTLAADRFAAHLDLVGRRSGAGSSARDWLAGRGHAATILTFDDGHLSNFTLALPLLVEHAARADFFVNPGRVGEAGFADWRQLAEMARAGMSIQSHGWAHRYFTDMTPDALREDLVRFANAPLVTRVGGMPEFERGTAVEVDILGMDELSLELDCRFVGEVKGESA